MRRPSAATGRGFRIGPASCAQAGRPASSGAAPRQARQVSVKFSLSCVPSSPRRVTARRRRFRRCAPARRCSTSSTKILPSPILSVLAVVCDGLDDLVGQRVGDHDLEPDLRHEVHGVFGAAIDLGVARLAPNPLISVTIMPRTPMAVSASRTSSSLNGLIAAMMSFTSFPFRCAARQPALGHRRQEGGQCGARTRKPGSDAATDSGHGCTIFAHIWPSCLNFRRTSDANRGHALTPHSLRSQAMVPPNRQERHRTRADSRHGSGTAGGRPLWRTGAMRRARGPRRQTAGRRKPAPPKAAARAERARRAAASGWSSGSSAGIWRRALGHRLARRRDRRRWSCRRRRLLLLRAAARRHRPDRRPRARLGHHARPRRRGLRLAGRDRSAA